MLHRAKYNRFRNESVTSVDELLHGLSMNAKVSAVPPSPPVGDPLYAPPAEVLPPDPVEETGTLCTLINKVSNLKFANSSGLLGIKGLPSAVKDLAVSKLQGGATGGGSGSPGSSTLPAASGAPHAPPEPSSANSGKKGRMEESQPGGEGWGLGTSGAAGCGGLVNKPSRGWLHSAEKISGPGVTYVVKVRSKCFLSSAFPLLFSIHVPVQRGLCVQFGIMQVASYSKQHRYVHK